MRKFLLLFAIGLSLFDSLNAQITGRIFATRSNNPLTGVSVHNGTQTVISDNSGHFYIQALQSDTLIIQSLGFKTETVILTDTSDLIKVDLQNDYTRIAEVIIQGPLFPAKLKQIPSALSSIGPAQLNEPGIHDITELLSRAPGVLVQSGTLNTKRITIRGVGSRTPYGTNRIKAFYNFIPISNADGFTELEDIASTSITDIEILKGTKSALYGAGLGGIILLNDSPYAPYGLHLSAEMKIGSFNTCSPSITVSRRKNNTSLILSHHSLLSNGYRENSQARRHNTRLSYRYGKGKFDTRFLFQHINTQAYIPSSLDEETFNENPRSAALNWLAVEGHETYSKIRSGLSSAYRFTDKTKLRWILYSNYLNAYEVRPFNILDDHSLQIGGKAIFKTQIKQLKIRSGIELTREQYNWQLYEIVLGEQGGETAHFEDIKTGRRLFVEAAIPINDWLYAETGISYESVKYRLNDLFRDTINLSGRYRYKPILSPFLGINLKLTDWANIYASVGHGYSYPTVEETLLPEGNLNTALKPESGTGIDSGTRLTLFRKQVFIDLAFYRMRLNNLLLTERLSEDVFTGKNAGKTKHRGIELSAIVKINRDFKNRLPAFDANISSAITEARFTEFTDKGQTCDNNYLPGIPAVNHFLRLQSGFKSGAYLNVNFRYTGSQYLNDLNTLSHEAYKQVNLKAGINFDMNDKIKWQIYGGINNLLNEAYASMVIVNAVSFGTRAPRYYYPGQPRAMYIGFKFKLK